MGEFADARISDIAHVIQLAIAPVFLLTGVGALLAVLVNRLVRIIDRARMMESKLPAATPDELDQLHQNLRIMSRRAKLINFAISLAVLCALLVCLVIVALFSAAFIARPLDALIGGLFVASMFALIGALVAFLREIYISTAVLRIGPH